MSRPATREKPAGPPPYRVRRYLRENGISLKTLVQQLGGSATTWSRALNGEPRPLPAPRAEVERVLRDHGLPVPAWLWDEDNPTSGADAPVPAIPSEAYMNAQFLSEGAKKRFKLFDNPFAAAALFDGDGQARLESVYTSRAHTSVNLLLQQAANFGGFVAVHGPPGSGKSTLRARALADAARFADPHRLVVVTPANIERRSMTLGHIVMELLQALTDDQIPQATNARDAMLEKVLLRYHKDRDRVVLLIEEAHELRAETIKDLKRLHEGRHGFIPLLGILLVGQPELRVKLDPTRNPQLTEVALRAAIVEMPSLAEGEIRAYLQSRLQLVGERHVDSVFSAGGIIAIERLLGGGGTRPRTPLVVNNLATAALNCAAFCGEDLVTENTIQDVQGANPEILQMWGVAA